MNNAKTIADYCEKHLSSHPEFDKYVYDNLSFIFLLLEESVIDIRTRKRIQVILKLRQNQNIKTEEQIFELQNSIIDFVGLKGYFLQCLYYPNEYTRLFGDVDVLINPKDGYKNYKKLKKIGYSLISHEGLYRKIIHSDFAITILKGLYTRNNKHIRMKKDGFDLIELHTNINDNCTLTCCNRFPIEKMILESTVKYYKNIKFRTFQPEDYLIYLMVHAIQHLSFVALHGNSLSINLQKFYDVAQIISIEDIKWDLFKNKTIEYNAFSEVALFTKIFNDIYNTIPQKIYEYIYNYASEKDFGWKIIFNEIINLPAEKLILGDYSSVREIHKLLRSAFTQAVKWELMQRNPVLNATLPKEQRHSREIWTVETLLHALEVCEDDILSLAINLSFACSLRIGEMLGLTWDCITIDDESIRENNAQIFVNKELQRVDTETMKKLYNKEIIYVFPAIYNKGTTTLVLKTPKTFTSTRKIYLPVTVASMLKERKKQIEEAKEIYGDEYDDHNLVFCHPTGRPMEGQVINRALQKLIADYNLPKVVFHSFRHASITYKLKWNGGDMKSVQGDSGHSRMDMVAEVYSHIIDEDRRFNAQRFEEQFYGAKGIRNVSEGYTVPTPSFSKATELKKKEETENEELIKKLMNNPEAVALLKALSKQL